MLEWLEARCSDTHLQQVFWETHQRLHLLCAACLTGSDAICISQQPFHRRCYCLHPAYCSLPPGKQEHLCEDAVCGLQFRIQYHSACHTGCEAPDSRTKQISVQLDPGLSDRQKSGGQNGQQHFISADPQHWCSQGCVLSPLLYSLYTHDCAATHSSNVIVKFADDTTVIGLITDNDETAYRAEVSTLTKWCQENHLSLNIDKTKELVVDFRRQSREHTPITIDKTPVERVNSFKFPRRSHHWGSHMVRSHMQCWRSHISSSWDGWGSLEWAQHPQIILHLHCGKHPDRLHHRLVWNSTAGNRKALQRVVRTARHIVGGELPSLQDIYTRRLYKESPEITNDSSHPSHRLFSLLPSGRRLRSIRSLTSRLRDSFFPQAIRLMNSQNYTPYSTLPLYDMPRTAL